jgi:hypothetical protein
MADPLSIAASLIGVVAFAAQVGSAIKDFTDAYRGAELELGAIAAELSALSVVLQKLQVEYEKADIPSNSIASSGKRLDSWRPDETDEPLRAVLSGLDGSIEKLQDVVSKSFERMAKGGLYKVQVRALWQRTAKGINRVRIILIYLLRSS